MMNHPKRIYILVGLILGAVIGAGVWVWKSHFVTYHYVAVRPGVLYRSGNRDIDEFNTACHQAGIRTVVMLVSDDQAAQEPFRSEAEYCQQHAIQLVHIPIGTTDRPTTADVRQFLDIVSKPVNQPVLVHCAQGRRRTAMMVAAYQRTVMGMDVEQVKQAIRTFGHKESEGIRSFIDDYDPVTQSVRNSEATTRPQSPE